VVVAELVNILCRYARPYENVSRTLGDGRSKHKGDDFNVTPSSTKEEVMNALAVLFDGSGEQVPPMDIIRTDNCPNNEGAQKHHCTETKTSTTDNEVIAYAIPTFQAPKKIVRRLHFFSETEILHHLIRSAKKELWKSVLIRILSA